MEGVVSVVATSRRMTARSDRGQRCVDKMRLRKTSRASITAAEMPPAAQGGRQGEA
jgi:hypothetical protein